MNTNAMKNRQTDGWIDINKELPKDGLHITVMREGAHCKYAKTTYNTSKMPYGFACDAMSEGVVTHWKP